MIINFNEIKNDLNLMLKCAEAINEIYNLLYKLELNNQKNSPEYQNFTKHLSSTLEVEDQIYKIININNLIGIITLINTRKDLLDDLKPIIIERINMKCAQTFLNRKKPQSVANLLGDKIEYTLTENFCSDQQKLFLYYLNHHIYNSDFKTYKNSLLQVKYSLLFSTPSIEKYFIAANFVPYEIHLTHKLALEICQTEDCQKQKDVILSLAKEAYQNILSNINLDNSENFIELILDVCLFSSSLVLIDNKIIEQLNQQFESDKNKFNTYNILIIQTIFDNIKEAKGKHYTLSIKRP